MVTRASSRAARVSKAIVKAHPGSITQRPVLLLNRPASSLPIADAALRLANQLKATKDKGDHASKVPQTPSEEKPTKQDPDDVAKQAEEMRKRPLRKPLTSSMSSDNGNNNRSSASSSGGSGSSAPPSSGGSGGSGGGSGSGSTDLAKQSVPETYPQVLALPITRRPLFPGFYKAVVIRDPAVVAAIKEMLKRGQPYLGAFLLKNDDSDSDTITDINSVHPVGVFAQITSTFSNNATSGQGKGGNIDKSEGSGDLTVVLYPHRRIKMTELIPPNKQQQKLSVHGIQAQAEKDGVLPGVDASTQTDSTAESDAVTSFEPPSNPSSSSASPMFQSSFLQDFAVSRVNVENLPMKEFNKASPICRAVSTEIISVFKDIAQLNPLFRDQIANFSISAGSQGVFDDPERLADFAAAVSTGEPKELQDVLESLVIEERLQKSLLVLKKELLNAQLQSKISKDVDSRIQKRQREYYLIEQLKGIKRELGLESDGKDKLLEKFAEKAKSLNMPEAVKKVFDDEMSKMSTLEPAASEFNVARNYLDWLTTIPWGRHSEENFDLKHARTVLDEDHFGLKDVKSRIMEFLAVGKLRGTVQGKILCFVGPPGVGKTSIGKSIARALNRQFFRFSVGGLADTAEMKGHRRTYIGAMPGKFIQALKKVETENPLILIDEVDKLSRSYNGDPASALLEALDPEQNHAYLDHYLDVPVDLSRVLFVCTANSLDTIPAPLLDRMEVLEVSGYVADEKKAIAERFLGPQAREASGLKDVNVKINDEAIDVLIRYYCRESGVRRLKQQIEKIYRKAALKIVDDIGEEELPEPTIEELAAAKHDNSDQSTQEIAPTEAERKPEPQPSMGQSIDTSPEAPQSSMPPQQYVEEPSAAEAEEARQTTTKVRKPLVVPAEISVEITKDNLVDYIGPPLYQKDRIYMHRTPAGVATGLGYLGNGSGSCLPIEVTAMPGSGGVLLTGKLGEVIKESAQIGLSFLRTHAYTLGLVEKETDDILDKKAIHLHMPEGGVGKEGPSAGTAILTALVSLFRKQGISSELAITGEITLAGQVLAVGGLQEKMLAAQRAGVKTVIVPAACEADINHNVSSSVKEGMTIKYAEDVRAVLSEAFAGDAEFVSRIDRLPVSARS